MGALAFLLLLNNRNSQSRLFSNQRRWRGFSVGHKRRPDSVSIADVAQDFVPRNENRQTRNFWHRGQLQKVAILGRFINLIKITGHRNNSYQQIRLEMCFDSWCSVVRNILRYEWSVKTKFYSGIKLTLNNFRLQASDIWNRKLFLTPKYY